MMTGILLLISLTTFLNPLANMTSTQTLHEAISYNDKIVVLAENKKNGKCLLTKSMLSQENTTYIIQYDYSLAEDITIPSNSYLRFDGGSITDDGTHMLKGNNTGIEANLTEIFSADVNITGSWNVIGLYPEWFGAKGDGKTDDTEILNKVASLDIPMVMPVNKAYLVTSTIEVKNSLFGNESKIVIDENRVNYADVLHINRPPLTNPITIKDLYVVGNSKAAKKYATGIIVDGPHVILDNVKVQNFDVGIKVKKWSISLMNCHSNFNNVNLCMYSSGEGNQTTLINDINVIGGNYSTARSGWAIKIGDNNQSDIKDKEFNGARILLQGFCFDGGSVSINHCHTITLDGLYGESPKAGYSNVEVNSFADGKVANIEIRNCYLRGGEHGIRIPRRTSHVNIHNNTFQNIKYCCVYTEWPSVLKYHSNQIINPSGYPAVHTAAFDNPSRIGETPSFYDLGENNIIYGNPSGERIKPGTVYVDKEGNQVRYVGVDGYIQTVPVQGVMAKKVSGSRRFVLPANDIKKFNGGDNIILAGRKGYIRLCDYANNTIEVYGNEFPQGGLLSHQKPTVINVPIKK